MNDDLKAEILALIDERVAELALSSLHVPFHQHQGVDSPTLDAAKSLKGAPQSTITADIGSTAGATYTSTEQNLINNLRARVNDIYSRLQTLGLIK